MQVGNISDPNAYATYSYDINGNLYQEKLNNGGVTRTHIMV